MKRKFYPILIYILFMISILSACGINKNKEKSAASVKQLTSASNDIIILYTNDIHCAVLEDKENGVLGYSKVAGYKKELENQGNTVVLVDVGDAIQGGTIGTLSKGSDIVDIMNTVGYDIAIPGNHEFDYGMNIFFDLTKQAEYTYISCNFMNLEKKKPVLQPYKILQLGDKKVAFVGISTPRTITTSTPKYFQNEKGEYTYGFCQGESGEELYQVVQETVDEAKNDGADYVITLSHLGIGEECSPWKSTDVVEHTRGIDVFLDGHSHSTLNGEMVRNLDGKNVLLSSTGSSLAAIGKLTIRTDGTFTCELVNDNIKQDEEVTSYINNIEKKSEDTLSQVVAKTEIPLVVSDPDTLNSEEKVRIVRNTETNLGDLCADAYRAVTGADIAFVNAGGIRDDIFKGDISYGDIIDVHPFGNGICMVKATGQQIIDALEIGASAWPEENGSFLQVSGLTYEIHTDIKSSVTTDENGMFTGVTGDYRVQNIKIDDKELELDKTYTVASNNYILKNAGDGMNMFQGDDILLDEFMLDNQALIQYITVNLNGVVGQPYQNPYGDGRIVEIE